MNFIESFSKDIQALNGEVFYVGGWVRDYFSGIPNKDLDLIVVGINSQQLLAVLTKFGCVGLQGKSFGVYRIKIDDRVVEVALPRKESSSGTGHRDFKVCCDKDITLEEDLLRRDFTINALARSSITGKFIDPYQGLTDLKRGVLRQLSLNSMSDDYLRALRAIQFVARLGFTLEQETLNSIKQNISLLKTISKERVTTEILKFLQGKRIIKAYEYMRETGLDIEIFTWRIEDLNDLEGYNRYNYSAHNIIRFCLLLQELESEQVALFLARLTLGKSMSKAILSIFKYKKLEPEDEYAFRKMAVDLGIENLLFWLEYKKCSTQYPLNDFIKQKRWSDLVLSGQWVILKKNLKISGKEILNLGIKGKQVGEVLGYLLEIVLKSPELNTKKKLLEYIVDIKYLKNI